MAKKSNKLQQLHFIYTSATFKIDIGDYDDQLSAHKKIIEEDSYKAFYNLGFHEIPEWMDATGKFIYQICKLYIYNLYRFPNLELMREKVNVELNQQEIDQLVSSVPFTLGFEYVNKSWIKKQIKALNQVYQKEISEYSGGVALYLAEKTKKLKIPERVFFHLVEHKDEEYPFAFLATYSTRDEKNRIRHMPLQYALTEYKSERKQLIDLLSCLNKAADCSAIIDEFVKKGEMFHPLRLTSKEAYMFLKDVEKIEEAGIVCRIPNWWNRKSTSVSMSIKLGENEPALLGLESLISMQPTLVVDGMELSKKDIEKLLVMSDGLTMIKGKWIEVNHQKLQELIDQMDQYEGEISLIDAMRMNIAEPDSNDHVDIGNLITNGQWLNQLLHKLRTPKLIKEARVPKAFQATLRPYQKTGYTWLNYMYELGFGGCLADDMGLGKTIQLLAFLERIYHENKNKQVLLIVPTSLVGNWKNEANKFAPDLPVRVLHGLSNKKLEDTLINEQCFMNITTYGMASRIEGLKNITWDCLILDEAQAIKNPGTKQTKTIKEIPARMRFALTGTPIENNLTNLWSLFDFLNKGLLGSSKEFGDFISNLNNHPEGYAKLKDMIYPFMLRRVKTDKSIISDLPDKIEQNEYISLTKKQTVLYKQYVSNMVKLIEETEGIQRRGIVLASLNKLKQICNHPDQYLGIDGYDPKDSGKFDMLRELCETIYERRERVLIFSQFTEIIPGLDDFLQSIFHTKGFVLQGSTSAKQRNEMVKQFQSDEYIPYMILSLKAGGTGLTLTKANHVIHFDRWWNPAVENQATDRAYRIGQKNKVIVHKFVCKGTIEEKIDQLLSSKRELADSVIGNGAETWITEMSNDEIIDLFKMD